MNGCSFTNTSAVAYDGADPGSALQVFNSDLMLTDSKFESNKGTPLYVESSSRGKSYSLEVCVRERDDYLRIAKTYPTRKRQTIARILFSILGFSQCIYRYKYHSTSVLSKDDIRIRVLMHSFDREGLPDHISPPSYLTIHDAEPFQRWTVLRSTAIRKRGSTRVAT